MNRAWRPELTPLIYNAREVNDSQPHFVFDLIQRALGSLRGKKIAALGLAYKADVDDLRESPAAEVVHLLLDAGAQVKAWEPFKPGSNLEYIASSLDDAIKEADASLLLVNHTQFRELDPAQVAAKTATRILIDTVNGWNAAIWRAAGFTVLRLGVSRPSLEIQKQVK